MPIEPSDACGSPEEENMELREVEVELRLNIDGKVVEPGAELEETQQRDAEEDSEPDIIVKPKLKPHFAIPSRITNTPPAGSNITVYGLEHTSRPCQSGPSAASGNLGDISAYDKSDPVLSSAHHDRKPKKPKNDWWTTSVKVFEERPKLPVMGILDPHTGQPHVRQNTQPTRALWQTADDDHTLERNIHNFTDSIPTHQPNDESCYMKDIIVKRPDDTINVPTVEESEACGDICMLAAEVDMSDSPRSMIEFVFIDEMSSQLPCALEIPGMWDFRGLSQTF